MKSTGNDIVALNFIDSKRSSHSAFYSKFITETELKLHLNSLLTVENFVWLLWSVKESAYKYLQRHISDLVFSPSKIKTQTIAVLNTPVTQFEGDTDGVFYAGEVFYDETIFYFLSKVNSDFIATVVNSEPSFKQVYWGAKLIDKTDSDSQSKAVRVFLLNKLAQLFPNDDLHIEKTDTGYPVLLNGDRKLAVPVSFAHHGNYVAYSFIAD